MVGTSGTCTHPPPSTTSASVGRRFDDGTSSVKLVRGTRAAIDMASKSANRSLGAAWEGSGQREDGGSGDGCCLERKGGGGGWFGVRTWLNSSTYVVILLQ